MNRGLAHRVVGFDGSPAALAALRWAAGEARLYHADLLAASQRRPTASTRWASR
jgi:nucleotide-binding universal stress UspA family protein